MTRSSAPKASVLRCKCGREMSGSLRCRNCNRAVCMCCDMARECEGCREDRWEADDYYGGGYR